MTAGRKNNSVNKEWCTPKKYADLVFAFFGKAALDPCSNHNSIIDVYNKYILPKDGLVESWDCSTIYVNPPYGRDPANHTSISNWIEKCSRTNMSFDSEILALIPVATNTSYWKKYIWQSANAICFLSDTRLKFLIDGSEDNKGAPMACCMVYWGSNFLKFKNVFSSSGAIIKL